MSDVNQLVARNVRRFREERTLSLGELARRAGLSKQTLSKIESGSGNPTVETLSQLGEALELPPRGLLTEWGSPVLVLRSSDAQWTDRDRWSERVLDETYGSGYVRTLVLHLTDRDGSHEPIRPQPPGTLHHVYVLDGRLRTGPVTEPVEVGPGDFVRFPGDVPHRHVCLGESVTAHVVTTLPQTRQFEPRR